MKPADLESMGQRVRDDEMEIAMQSRVKNLVLQNRVMGTRAAQSGQIAAA